MSKDKERDALVDAIIGSIPDLNFDEEEMIPMSDEEVAEIEEEYRKNPYILTEEEDKRAKDFIARLSAHMRWAWAYRKKGEKPPYDFTEWDNLSEKPEIVE